MKQCKQLIQSALPRRKYLSGSISVILCGFSSFCYGLDLNNANIDTLNSALMPRGDVYLTSPTSTPYLSDKNSASAVNSSLSGGRWINFGSNINTGNFDLIITTPSLSVKNYIYQTSAGADAGGALSAAGPITINGNVIFDNNGLESMNTVNSLTPGEIDRVGGGAIASKGALILQSVADNGSLSFINNYVSLDSGVLANSNINGYGGAIFSSSNIEIKGNGTAGNLALHNFSGNRVDAKNSYGGGGAIAGIDRISLSGDFINYNFENNSVTGQTTVGGALYADNQAGRMNSINMNANNSVYNFDGNSVISNNGGVAKGGAIGSAFTGSDSVYYNLLGTNSEYIFKNNLSQSNGHSGLVSYAGAIYLGGALYMDGDTNKYTFLTNSVNADNAAGGALAVGTTEQMYNINNGGVSEKGKLSIANAIFDGNSVISDTANSGYDSTAKGGAIFAASIDFAMIGNNVLTNNYATATTQGSNNTVFAAGGAIYSTTEVFKPGGVNDNTNISMTFTTRNAGEKILFADNYYSTTDANNTVVTTANDIYWDATHDVSNISKSGLHNVVIDTAADSSIEMLSSIGSNQLAHVNITKNGLGTWVLAGESKLEGETNIAVNGGSLELKDSNTVISLDNSAASASSFKIGGAGTVIGNYGKIIGHVTNEGSIYAGSNPIISSISTTNNIFTIDGNYTGNNGNLYLAAELADDASPTEMLSITGDASGKTAVHINNLGGMGDQTINGIKVINVDGASTTNAFVATNIVAGKYEYSLVKGGLGTASSDTQSWYLTSRAPSTPGTGGGGGEQPVLRPEGGAYLANLVAANSIFNLRLHDRLGETQYTDLLTGEEKVTSMWIRGNYGYNKYTDSSKQLNIKADWDIVQLGGDIAQWSNNGLDRFHLGVMAGYGRSNNKVTSDISTRKSKSKINGYSIGLYGTWYSNEEDKTGLYVDGWGQWSDFDASVESTGIASEKYNLSGFSASVESGYSFLSTSWDDYSLWLQPKGQLTWSNIDADRHVEANNTVVTGDGSNFTSRLGIRASFNSNDSVFERLNQSGQLFVELNWLHNFNKFSVTMDGEDVTQAGAQNIGEIKAGVEGNISKNTNLWFNFAHQRGSSDYSSSGIMFGAKYSF